MAPPERPVRVRRVLLLVPPSPATRLMAHSQGGRPRPDPRPRRPRLVPGLAVAFMLNRTREERWSANALKLKPNPAGAARSFDCARSGEEHSLELPVDLSRSALDCWQRNGADHRGGSPMRRVSFVAVLSVLLFDVVATAGPSAMPLPPQGAASWLSPPRIANAPFKRRQTD